MPWKYENVTRQVSIHDAIEWFNNVFSVTINSISWIRSCYPRVATFRAARMEPRLSQRASVTNHKHTGSRTRKQASLTRIRIARCHTEATRCDLCRFACKCVRAFVYCVYMQNNYVYMVVHVYVRVCGEECQTGLLPYWLTNSECWLEVQKKMHREGKRRSTAVER